MLGEITALAMVVALSPFTVLPAIALVVHSDRPRPTGLAFISGWLVAKAAITALFVGVPRLMGGLQGTPPHWTAWLRVAAGVAFILAALWYWRRPGAAAAEATWVDRIKRITPAAAAFVGVALTFLNPKLVFACAAAGFAIRAPAQIAIDAAKRLRDILFIVLPSARLNRGARLGWPGRARPCPGLRRSPRVAGARHAWHTPGKEAPRRATPARTTKDVVMSRTLAPLFTAALCTLGFTGCLADETAAELDPATSEIAARIQAAAAAANFHGIRNKAYDQCVEAPGGKLNVLLKLSICGTTPTQKWSFVAAGPANTFFLVNQSSGLCMEVNNGTATPGERVDEFYCNGSTAEQWVAITRLVGGVAYQQYQHAGTNQCLDTVSGKGSNLMQYTCSPSSDAQSWLVQ